MPTADAREILDDIIKDADSGHAFNARVAVANLAKVMKSLLPEPAPVKAQTDRRERDTTTHATDKP